VSVTLKPLVAAETSQQSAHDTRGERIAQTIAIAAMYAAPALFCLRLANIADADVFWHLRTGEWILQHHAVPHVDPFSSATAGKPWDAYSWLFEVLIFRLSHAFGLAGIVACTTAMVLAITVALHHLVRRLQPDFSLTVLLTITACLPLGHLFFPRPWLFSILFLIIEVDILMFARKTNRLRELACLPLLFALWANLHIQFIDGLIVLGIAFAESIVARRLHGRRSRTHPLCLGAVLLASIVAVAANPYGWHIYRTSYDLASQPGVLDRINELKALPFRELPDFCVLFLALAAAAALARAVRIPLFETALLLFAAVVSFRSQRDVWLVTIVAVAILANRITGSAKAPESLPPFGRTVATLAAGATLFAAFPLMHLNNAFLAAKLSNDVPVKAVEFVQQRGYSGPLYNDFNWGGYLIWSLRQPVSIDGRAALHGDRELDRAVATTGAQPGWSDDPELASAHLIILPVKSPIVQVLRLTSKYEVVYEDSLAAVLIVRTPQAPR